MLYNALFCMHVCQNIFITAKPSAFYFILNFVVSTDQLVIINPMLYMHPELHLILYLYCYNNIVLNLLIAGRNSNMSVDIKIRFCFILEYLLIDYITVLLLFCILLLDLYPQFFFFMFMKRKYNSPGWLGSINKRSLL